MNGLWLSIYWEVHNPNWRRHIFQRGSNHQPVYCFCFTHFSVFVAGLYPKVGKGTRAPYLLFMTGCMFAIPAALRYAVSIKTLPGLVILALVIAGMSLLIECVSYFYVSSLAIPDHSRICFLQRRSPHMIFLDFFSKREMWWFTSVVWLISRFWATQLCVVWKEVDTQRSSRNPLSHPNPSQS